MSDNPLLRRGAQDEWVTYLQQVLEYAGHSPGAVDGVFGEDTETAVRSFQEARDLTVDGIVGSDTWDALAGATQPAADGGSDQGAQSPATEDSVGSVADWGPDPTQWTEAQQDQYFSYNDVLDVAEDLGAEVDVPEIQEA